MRTYIFSQNDIYAQTPSCVFYTLKEERILNVLSLILAVSVTSQFFLIRKLARLCINISYTKKLLSKFYYAHIISRKDIGMDKYDKKEY